MDHAQEPLLTAEEVAEYLRTTPNTVYRWCRSGKLPAKRIAKEWRISRAELDQALTERRAPRGHPLAQILSRGLRKRDHVAVITPSRDEVYNVESVFFQVALEKQRRLFKGCWWQHPDDVRERLSRDGLPVAELEAGGRLVIADLTEAFRRGGIDGVVKSWTEVAREAERSGAGSVWGSGSPHRDCCGVGLDSLLGFEGALHRATAGYPVVALCPYYFEDELPTDVLVGLAQYHTGMLLWHHRQPVLLRQT